MRPVVGVAVVGAGPYGLSVAAHLSAQGHKPRVFGRTMETWLSHMPKGMVLKSEGFAMDLSEPEARYSLGDFCAEQGIAEYRSIGWPVPVEVFAAYGQAFQKRFVPQVEDTNVRSISRGDRGFELVLETGEELTARNVVIATGIRPYAHLPAELKSLPTTLVSHSGDHGTMAEFAGRHVAVLGGGASAMDVAASLHRAGAKATVVTRRAEVRFYSPTSFRSIKDRLLAPMTPLGPGWKKFLCVKLPDIFRVMPDSFRHKVLMRYLGPSPAWSVREIIEAHVDVRLKSTIASAREAKGGLVLALKRADGETENLAVDHVISATGYAVDVAQVPALDGTIRSGLRCANQAPLLSRNFETSEPGLFFVGTPSATSFGPMLRFVCGAAFAATRVSQRIVRAEAAARAKGGREPVFVWRPSNGSVRT